MKTILKFITLMSIVITCGCAAGTLTITDSKGIQKSYRVLDCKMNLDKVTYTDMKGEIKTVDTFSKALYENKFNAAHYESCETCN